MKIEELQKKILSSVLSNKPQGNISERIIPGGKLSVQSCLEAYSNDYTARLTSTLGDNFESIWTVLGDQDFFELCKAYIKKFPSKLYDLGEYGNELPLFLENHELPYLKELANLEIHFRRLFNGKPQNALGPESFQDIDNPEVLIFDLTPLHYASSSEYALYKIWEQRNRTEEKKPLDIQIESESFLMYNSTGIVEVIFLSSLQLKLFIKLSQGHSLSASIDLCEGISEEETTKLFADLVSNGLILSLS